MLTAVEADEPAVILMVFPMTEPFPCRMEIPIPAEVTTQLVTEPVESKTLMPVLEALTTESAITQVPKPPHPTPNVVDNAV